MSTESSRDQNAVATAGGSSHPGERRAANHPTEVKVFGGSRAAERRMGVGAGVVWSASIVLIAMAWWVYIKASANQLDYKPGVGFGYYLGLVGGVMMLLMLLYPVRKHLQFARSWGPLRYWFMLHMIFGIGGPVLVLFHSTFHVRSLNAGVALYSMLLVVASGIIGRFIYKRIHHGLYGRKSNLEELQQAVDVNQNKVSKVNAGLMEATGIDEKLKKFRMTGHRPKARAGRSRLEIHYAGVAAAQSGEPLSPRTEAGCRAPCQEPGMGQPGAARTALPGSRAGCGRVSARRAAGGTIFILRATVPFVACPAFPFCLAAGGQRHRPCHRHQFHVLTFAACCAA